MLARLAERAWRDRIKDLCEALAETDPVAHPEDHQTLQRELFRVQTQRPHMKTAEP